MSKYLYGIHDSGGEYLFGDKTGWIVHTIDVRSDERLYYTNEQARRVTPIVRLNWSHHGAGTIPPDPADWDRFAWLCANYVRGCMNVNWITIGNEPNLRVEWGKDDPITPQQYAACYRQVYDAIKAVSPDVLIAPAAVGPWNVDAGIDWIEYFKRMVDAIGPERVDWINLHTYSRGYEPRAVTDNTRMDAPYSAYFNGFRSYLDFLAAVPAELRHLPVHITEANGNGPWPDSNTGWVQAAYAEIDRNNRLASTQKIYSLCLFRWPKFDTAWQFETKPGVHEDFRAAVEKGYRVPELVNENLPDPIHKPDSVSQGMHKVYVPHVQAGAAQPQPNLPPREWDERLTRRKVQLVEYEPKPGEMYWRLVKAEYLEEKEHIFVNVLDVQGRPRPGVTVVCFNGGEVGRLTEDKSNDPYALGMVNFPMHAAGWAYSVRVEGMPSDVVKGMGLGTYDEPTVGHHISYRLTFQAEIAPFAAPQPQPEQPKPHPATVPQLVHPVADPAYRTITQRFGERPDYYRQFAVDGVALKGHNGVDFGTPEGTPIVPVDEGTVVEAANDPEGYGLYVKLRHAWGESLYAHLSSIRVTVGEPVAQGAPFLGVSGNTGNSTGPHLHFGLRVNPFDRRDGWGGFVDPLPYLQQDHATQPAQDVVEIVREAAREFGVDEHLFLSQIMAESSFDPVAVSDMGARGLGQLMQPTWEEWSARIGAKNIFSPRDNARVAAAYMAWLLRHTKTEWAALVAYGFGIGNVQSGKPVPRHWETYAAKVMHGKWLLDNVGGKL